VIIIKLIGGLGNQMFQYALYKKFKQLDRPVKLDRSWLLTKPAHNGYELDRVFDIHGDFASFEEVHQLGDCKSDLFSKIKRRIFGVKSSHYIHEKFEYDPKIWKMEEGYLDGYWQSEKFFLDCKEQVVGDFLFKGELGEKNRKVKALAEAENSVSLHVRRGDYIANPKINKKHGNICNNHYYKQGIEHMERVLAKPLFIIFSDDMDWVIKNLKLKNGIYVDWNTKDQSYKDMWLMSCCKNNIIANSSFSWWGAYLNRNPDKVVIAPNRWFNDRTINTNDVVPENWQKIKV